MKNLSRSTLTAGGGIRRGEEWTRSRRWTRPERGCGICTSQRGGALGRGSPVRLGCRRTSQRRGPAGASVALACFEVVGRDDPWISAPLLRNRIRSVVAESQCETQREGPTE